MKKTIIALFLLLAMMASSLVACTPTPSNTTTTEKAYTVEFLVDGAYYASRNLYVNKAFNLPKAPTKEGFTFDGWYWDDGTFTSPLNADTLANQADGIKLRVYPKWVAYVAPTLQTPTAVTLNDNVLSWNAVDGAAQYEIQVGELSFFTDRTTFDLLGKITQQGRYLVYVRALSENSNTANSAWSVGVPYTIASSGNPTGNHKAFEYGVGFGYNVVNSAYYDARKTSTYSPLDLSKLAAYVGTVAYSESSANYASGETIADYMESYSLAIGTKVGASGQYKCFTAGVETNFSNSFSAKIDEHNYQSFFTYFQNVEKDAYAVKNCSEESFRNMLSSDFLRQINREVAETKNLSDQELAIWLIERYGTHIVTGVSLGGRIECSYYVSAKSSQIGMDVISKLQLATNAGISGIFSANASMDVETNASSNVSQSDKRVVMTVNTYGGNSALISAMKGDFSNENYNAWAESVNESPNAVRLVDGGLLALHVLLPVDEKYDGLREALYNKYMETADSAYNSILSKYQMVVSDTRTIDLTSLYSADSNDVDVMASDFKYYDLYNSETGIFTIRGALNGVTINRYVFKGLYQKQDKDGNTCSTILKNFSIQIDAEHDVEIVFDGVAFEGVTDYSVVFLNPNKTQNIKVTLTANGKNSLLSKNADSPKSTICLDRESTLVIAGSGNLTVTGGNGTDATATGASGSNGGVGITANDLIVNMTGKLTVTGGNGGNGVNGANGVKGSPSYIGHDDRNATGGGANGGNGTNGGNGGNGGKGGYAYNVASITILNGIVNATGGNSGNGGNGGTGGAGGKGQEAGGWGTTAGNGGNGGKGGNGGNTYTVAASDGDENVQVNTGSVLNLVYGKAGTVGKGGAGGAGGTKGMHCDGDNCGQFLTGGDDGKNGTAGSSGSAGSIITIS